GAFLEERDVSRNHIVTILICLAAPLNLITYPIYTWVVGLRVWASRTKWLGVTTAVVVVWPVYFVVMFVVMRELYQQVSAQQKTSIEFEFSDWFSIASWLIGTSGIALGCWFYRRSINQ